MTKGFGKLALAGATALFAVTVSAGVLAHDNVTPQPVDTTKLQDIGEDWVAVNPYRGNTDAIRIGESAYGGNCARCHGLEAISGGIAPDLRYLEVGDAGDEWYISRYRHGAARDGKVFMPAFGEVIGQKAGWAIRAWLETKHEES
ncbi:cytochrome c-550 PedF [Sphingomonas sp. 37zxx]|uniref:cytochrome c-550 PedF n=1 Tax=Sphingomonas sp. 37zxx TaxID=1550073 RepID=UPI00053BF7DA|nr:cytochrome c-550 PedF [Sphingomonas sp. 37zxx]